MVSVHWVIVVAGACVAVGARLSPKSSSPEVRVEFDETEFRKLEAAAVAEGKDGVEVRTAMVYRFQPYSFPIISGCNAALDVGQIVYLAGYTGGKVGDENEVIVQHKMEFKVATDTERAERHYVKLNYGQPPDKDPVALGIDTVGLLMKKRGGWLSFPSHLECRIGQQVGNGCAWRDLGRVKTIHSTCLMKITDDGDVGSGMTFPEFLFTKQIDSQVDVGTEEGLGPSGKRALHLFHRAFDECPDVWPTESMFPTLGLHTKGTPVRRCCCFSEENDQKFPRWAKKSGVCLPDVGPRSVFAGMWSMTASSDEFFSLSEHGQAWIACTDGMRLYRIDKLRGRCLTNYEHIAHQPSVDLLVTQANFGATNRSDTGLAKFENVVPALSRSNWQYVGGQLVMGDNINVCNSGIGMHRDGCDCTWSGERC